MAPAFNEHCWHQLTEEITVGMRDWRAQHPKATLREIEDELDRRHAHADEALDDHLTGQVERGRVPGVAVDAVAFDDLMLHDLNGLGRRQVTVLRMDR